MRCPRCQHENRPQATFCESCGTSLTANPSGQPAPSNAEIISALSEALEQQKATAELLQTPNRELVEAQEQQAATAEILRVISSSPSDVQPVFAAVLRSAARLCDALDASIFQVDGDGLRLVAHDGPIPGMPLGEFPLIRGMTVGRAVLDRRTIHVRDLQAQVDEYPEASAFARSHGFRTTLSVPLLRGTEAIGAIGIRRPEVRPFTDRQIELLQTFGAQAVIAIENVRLFQELQARNLELAGALERETATKEVLETISRSAFDLPAVLGTLIERATRLCRAEHGAIFRVARDFAHLEADNGGSPEFREFRRRHPIPLGPGSASGRAAAEGHTVHIADALAEPDYRESEAQRLMGFRTLLTVPMLREGRAIGVISLWRTRVEPFDDREIALVTTFANQAVIASENVRLFTELEGKNLALTKAHAQVTEALDQQTATSEILRVISSSPTDVQPVFDSIVASAVRLCGGLFGSIYLLDGELVDLVGTYNLPALQVERFKQGFPVRPHRGLVGIRAILDGAVVQAPDVTSDPEFRNRELADAVGMRSIVAVPMLRDGRAIGALSVGRRAPGLFPASLVGLLETFADQAVIAIENVRLFKELEARNRDLTESLEQQTATSDILRVIASSPTDMQPVFDTIARNAARLCDATHSILFRFEGELLAVAATHNFTPEEITTVRRDFPRRPGREFAGGRSVLEHGVVHIDDVLADTEYRVGAQSTLRYRTILGVPMLREGGNPVGAVAIWRREVRPFSDAQIALVRTFANQAVIAIENVRLFKELEARTQDLTRSVGELRALGDVGRALSSTLDLDTVLQTIVTRASQLAGTDACSVYEYDGATEAFHLRATHNLDEEVVALSRRTPTRKGEGIQGRMALTRQPVQIPDIAVEEAYRGPLRDILLRTGTRALLAVPMLREDELIGGLTVNKKTPGAFAPEVIELLETFATQSALAIQNARLFREIADKGRQLEAASRHKSEFLANMSHELRTPLNAILGFSEVLAERMFGEVNEKQAEYLQDILSSGRHLLSLINDILDLSKVEAGRLELELGRFHLPTALDNALTLVRERATRHGITLTQTVGERVADIVADERKVKQILLNLLSNAVKFTPEGGWVGLTATAADRVVTIAVSDTGVGIAPEDQAAIFEEFRQVGRDDTRKQEGTGLGLTLAKKFVELHGGRIWVESQVGQGSTFNFTLPLRLDDMSGRDQGGGEPPRP